MELAFELSGNIPFIQACVNGHSAWFVLDSGAQGSTLDTKFADTAHITTEMTAHRAAGVGGKTIQLWRALDVTAEIGGVQVALGNPMVFPVSLTLSPYVGREIGGVLGFDFFNRYAVSFDFDRNVVTIQNDEPVVTPDMIAVPIRIERNHMHLTALINGIEATLVVDTGAFLSLHLFSPFINRHNLSFAHAIPTLVGGIGGTVSKHIGYTQDVRFGSVRLSDVPAVFAESGDDMFAGHLGADGVLGMEILKRYNFIVDYPRQRLLLTPTARLKTPFPVNLSGLMFSTEGDGVFKIAAVAPDSMGERAGLKPGDYLLTVDGLPVSNLSIDSLFIVMQEAREVRFTISREGQFVEIILNLCEYIKRIA